ncbi:winged helix-turn-helix domain-containing protein [Phytohabitans kaempferiae]|uniref:Winged helix-turn-helix domain-containing protein n=1 Tax=Phytohabitans kaempferiae TaxID=1620943 RepID=A0ABV6MAC8_9ACTN
MRYGDGGGTGPQARARREQVRLRAAKMFAAGMSAPDVAEALEISTKSAHTWRRAWVAGGDRALVSKGAPGPQRVLSESQVQKLIAKLHEGPAAAGWVEDQRWTLARVRTLIGRMFHVTVAVCTVWQVLRRAGFTAQQPSQPAAERDEQAIARWRRYQWPAVKQSRAGWARGSASSTSPDCRPDQPGAVPGPRVAIPDRAGRWPGRPESIRRGYHRLPRRPPSPPDLPNHAHKRRKGEPKGFNEAHFAELLDAAHQQLGGPILLVWDRLPAHKSARMRALITARRWLRVYHLPAYAPELNPAESVWSSLKRAMANLAPGGITELARITKNRLKSMQYQPTLINGFLTATGLHPP